MLEMLLGMGVGVVLMKRELLMLFCVVRTFLLALMNGKRHCRDTSSLTLYFTIAKIFHSFIKS